MICLLLFYESIKMKTGIYTNQVVPLKKVIFLAE